MSIPVPSIHSPPHSDPVWLRLHWRCICLPQPVSLSTHLHFSKHLQSFVCQGYPQETDLRNPALIHSQSHIQPAARNCGRELGGEQVNEQQWVNKKSYNMFFFKTNFLLNVIDGKKRVRTIVKNRKIQRLRSYCTGHWEIKREKTEREKRRRLWRDVIALVKRGCDRRWPQQWGDS